MKAHRPVDFLRVNGLNGDPAVYVFLHKSGDALLFDCGDLTPLPNRDLLKVRTLLVSHAHIDHFIGFDRLLRVNVPHAHPLEIIGPSGMASHVQGKLRGYLWNLLEPDQLHFTVHEVDAEGQVNSTQLRSSTKFALEPIATPNVETSPRCPPLKPSPVATIPLKVAGIRLEAVVLDHKTPSLAFACQMPLRMQVDTNALKQAQLTPGPWIKELQFAYACGLYEQPLTVNGKAFSTGELGDLLLTASSPRPIGYLTDAGFTSDNIARATTLLGDVETFICESNYRDSEAAKALQRMHLTTRQSALIAALAGVKTFEIFHVSNIYSDCVEAVREEAAAFFSQYKNMPRADLLTVCQGQFSLGPSD